MRSAIFHLKPRADAKFPCPCGLGYLAPKESSFTFSSDQVDREKYLQELSEYASIFDEKYHVIIEQDEGDGPE